MRDSVVHSEIPGTIVPLTVLSCFSHFLIFFLSAGKYYKIYSHFGNKENSVPFFLFFAYCFSVYVADFGLYPVCQGVLDLFGAPLSTTTENQSLSVSIIFQILSSSSI